MSAHLMSIFGDPNPDSSETGFGSEFSEEHRTVPHPHTLLPLPRSRGHQGVRMILPQGTWETTICPFWNCLVGYLLDNRQFSSYDMEEIVDGLWHVLEGVTVVGRNGTFLFSFVHREDMAYVVANGPCDIHGALLIVDFW